ncbi:MAG: hypothetical protein SVV80_07340 [Planctomycetota bacterium]|nr:hypothetical protein [Planctomycetota bacterium]
MTLHGAFPALFGAETSFDDDDLGFTAVISTSGDGITLSVRGRDGDVYRTVSMDFNLVSGGSGVFDYALASKGGIKMVGRSAILGANSPSEANVLSAATTGNKTFTLTGNACIEGDVYSPNAAASAQLSGNISIGGEPRSSEAILDHIHIGIEDQEFPEIDPRVFEPFATTVVNAGTPTSSGTFTNIRIAAGANPTFSGDVTIYGVVFVEQPNKVKFTGTTTITGVIVTQDAGDNTYNTNTIKFAGQTTAQGVEQLPDKPQYTALKELGGSFLPGPGFGVEFAGGFHVISGTMAADDFKFTGDAGGTVHGSVICYGSAELNLSGNSTLTYDRSGSPETPSGFVIPLVLAAVSSTYMEH